MAMQLLNFSETPLNFQKFHNHPKNQYSSTLKSLLAFLLSIFIYISIFYIFNLSPSTLFCTTKFWFFISNTLILIIAADFGSFSSKENDFYDEYLKKVTITKINNIPFSNNPQYVEKTTKNDKQEVDEKIIKMDQVKPNNVNPKNTNGKFERKKKKRKCCRSNSDKAIITAAAAEVEENEKSVVLQRTFSERHENEETTLEENEFSRMSNEELNRRVEEFIRRFNRQIRLQGASRRNQQNLEMNLV